MDLETFLVVTSILITSLLVWITIWMTQYQIYVARDQGTYTVVIGFYIILIAILGLMGSIILAVFGTFANWTSAIPYAIALFGFSVSVSVLFAVAATLTVFSKLGADPFAAPVNAATWIERPYRRKLIFLSIALVALVILGLWLVLVPTLTDWTLT